MLLVAMLAEPQATAAQTDPAGQDQMVLLYDATWADYQWLLELRGDRPVPRLAFLEGVLELVRPSKEHEAVKSLVGCLVEVFCLERGVEFSPFGSWTLESKEAGRGAEPDECFIFGRREGEVTRPDLAIEVIRSSGGLDKRDLYRKLGVKELWFWKRGRFSVYVLRDGDYQERRASEVLAGIDLDELGAFLDRPTASQAMREYAAALRAQKVS